MLIGFMIPFEAVVIPLYHMLYGMGLTDSYWALILPQIGLSVSFGTFWTTGRAAGRPCGRCCGPWPGRRC